MWSAAGWMVAILTWSAPMHTLPRRFAVSMAATPTLKEQMLAYVKMVKEKGMVLTKEQKEMIAKFEEDDGLLEQTGLVDFAPDSSDADVEQQSPQASIAEAPPEPSQLSATEQKTQVSNQSPTLATDESVAIVSPTLARLWLLQRQEREDTMAMLRQMEHNQLDTETSVSLRGKVASLIYTLAASGA